MRIDLNTSAPQAPDSTRSTKFEERENPASDSRQGADVARLSSESAMVGSQLR